MSPLRKVANRAIWCVLGLIMVPPILTIGGRLLFPLTNPIQAGALLLLILAGLYGLAMVVGTVAEWWSTLDEDVHEEDKYY